MEWKSRVTYLRRIMKMRTIITMSRIKPMTMMTQAHGGVWGADSAGKDGGAASVWKVKVADQSLGVGSSVITLQK
jgi:hypothetical protein